MTVDTVSPSHTPAPLDPRRSVEKPRFSLEALQESRRSRALLGLLLVIAIVVTIYVIILAFTGHFTNVVKIDSQLPAGSNAVPIGAPVEYRNVTVGKVGSEGASARGGVTVKLFLYPAKIATVPKGVQAQVAPLSIFGNQYVNLVPPANLAAAHLAAGDVIEPYGGAPSTSLQGTVTQLYSLLHAVHPADLDTALTAFATALNGEGPDLGKALSSASTYLGAIAPHLPTVQSDLRLTDPATATIERSTPNILGILSNSTVTSQTITQQASELRTLLKSGTATVKQLADVLGNVQGTLPRMIDQSGPLLSDITQSQTEFSAILDGLTQFANAVAQAESGGPFLSVTANLPVVDISAGVNAALGYNNPASISQALGSAVNPPTYTSANCPRYPGSANPYCGVGGSPAAQPVAAASTTQSPTGRAQATQSRAGQPATTQGTAASYPYAEELQAVQDIAAALNGGQAPSSPGTASLLLYPLLSSMAGGS